MIEPLLDSWRALPHPEVGDAIEQHARWCDLPPDLRGLWPHRLPAGRLRLRQLAELPRSPVIAGLLSKSLHERPYPQRAARPLYAEMKVVLANQHDPRFQGPPETGAVPTHLRPLLQRVTEAVQQSRALEQQLVEQARHDDQALAVLADKLVERGALLGEWLLLELHGTRSQRTAWWSARRTCHLGVPDSLKPHIVAGTQRLTRGTVTAVRFSDRLAQQSSEQLNGPAFHTLRSVAFTKAPPGWVAYLPWVRTLEEVKGVRPDFARVCRENGARWSSIGFTMPPDAVQVRQLPGVRSISVPRWMSEEDVEALRADVPDVTVRQR